MGNLVNAFVNAGGMNVANPAAAVNNALSAQGAKQTNQMNALKLRDYESDKKASAEQQKLENKFKALTGALMIKDPTQGKEFYKQYTGEDIDLSGNEEQVTIVDDEGLTISGPRSKVLEWTEQVGTDGSWMTEDNKRRQVLAWAKVNNIAISAKEKVVGADTAATLKQREKEDVRKQVSDIAKRAIDAEESEKDRQKALEVAKIGATSRENVAQTNAMSKMDIKKLDQKIKQTTSDAKIPPNVQTAIKILNNYRDNSSSNAFEQVIANALSGNSEDTSIIAAGRQELSGTEQTIYDQAVKTVYEYFSGQGGSTAAGVTPEAGKVYVDANGNKAKYLGPGQWETIP